MLCLSVPKEAGIVVKRWIPRHTFGFPFSNRQRIVFASHARRKLRDYSSLRVQRRNRHIALAHNYGGSFGGFHWCADIRYENLFAGAIKRFTLVQTPEHSRTDMKLLVEQF